MGTSERRDWWDKKRFVLWFIVIVPKFVSQSTVRKQGCNRTNAAANYSSWVGEIGHNEELQSEMSRVCSRYHPACWKIGFCKHRVGSARSASIQDLHTTLVKTLIEQVKTMCGQTGLKILGRQMSSQAWFLQSSLLWCVRLQGIFVEWYYDI